MNNQSYVYRKEKDVYFVAEQLMEEIRVYEEVTKKQQIEDATLFYNVPQFPNLWGLLTKKNPTEGQIMKFWWGFEHDPWFDPVCRYGHVEYELKKIIRSIDKHSSCDMLLTIEDLNLLNTKVKYK